MLLGWFLHLFDNLSFSLKVFLTVEHNQTSFSCYVITYQSLQVFVDDE